MTDKLSRYKGAILGVAVGDALGAPLEFMTSAEIREKHGTVREMIGGGWLDVLPGEVTDDTQMTMAVADGIRNNPEEPYSDIGKRFIEWYDTNPKDIGNTCRAVICRAKAINADSGEQWRDIAKQLYAETHGNTAGNGGLMRTIYPAMFYDKNSGELAKEIGAMTHFHPDSDLPVSSYAAVISEILDAPEDMEINRAKELIELRMKAVRDKLGGRDLKPSGYVIDSAVCAMNAIRDTSGFEDALVYAVNLGGDADTIGAIAGGLAGAVYGVKEIPERWLNSLANPRNNALFGHPESCANLLLEWCEKIARKAYDHRNPKNTGA